MVVVDEISFLRDGLLVFGEGRISRSFQTTFLGVMVLVHGFSDPFCVKFGC